MRAGTAMTPSVPKLANLHGQVSEIIAMRVMGGTYEGVALPTEADLCADLGVSRTTLREAMKKLVGKGLVEVAPSRGTRVRPRRDWNLLDADVIRWRIALGVDAKLIADIYEMRECFEPQASAFAAERGTEAEHARIEAHFRDLSAWGRGAEPDRAAEADVGFHLAILEATHNEFLVSFATTIETMLRMSFRLARRRVAMSNADLAQHEAILRAILRRDPPAARRMTERLLAASKSVQMEAAAELSRLRIDREEG